MQSPQYGIDAPGLVRFFFMAGVAALTIFLIALISSIFSQTVQIIIAIVSGIAFTYLLGMGCLMLFYSKVQKLKDRDKLLDLIEWSGNELVLDVGCGRGLMLIGAAKLGDIINQAEYVNHFQQSGMINVCCHNNPIQDMVLKAITFGTFAPSIISASKPV